MEQFKASLAKGERLLDRMLDAGFALEHDCGGALACSSCLVIVREGAQALSAASEDELDMLERADALEPGARLACQALAEGCELFGWRSVWLIGRDAYRRSDVLCHQTHNENCDFREMSYPAKSVMRSLS